MSGAGSTDRGPASEPSELPDDAATRPLDERVDLPDAEPALPSEPLEAPDAQSDPLDPIDPFGSLEALDFETPELSHADTPPDPRDPPPDQSPDQIPDEPPADLPAAQPADLPADFPADPFVDPRTDPTAEPLPLPGPRAHLDPFAPGAVRLTPPPLPRRPRTAGGAQPLDRALAVVMATGWLGAVAAIALAGSEISGVAYATSGAWVLLLGLGIVVGRRFPGRDAVAWIAIAAAMSTILLRADGEELTTGSLPGLGSIMARTGGPNLSAGAVALTLSTAIACIATAWWASRARRIALGATGQRPATRVGHALEQYRLALEWNEVRQALTTPGTTIEQIIDSGRARRQHRWMGIDALNGRATIRSLGPDVEERSWVVFDARGDVLAIAPPTAPRAWALTVKRAARRRATGPAS